MANVILGTWLVISVFVSILNSTKGNLKLSEKKHIYLLSSISILFLLLMFQSESSNGDLKSYYNMYNRLGLMSYDSFFDIFFEIKSPVLYLTGKIFYSLNFSFFWWKTFISLTICYAVYRIISDYSANHPLSIIIFISLGYYSFTMSGLRQTMAIAFILLSYKCIKEKKLIKFIILVIIAFFCHNTALIFLIAYPIYKLKFNWKNTSLIIFSGFIIFIFRNTILSKVFELLEDTNLESYSTREATLTLSGFIIFCCILVFCLFYSKEIKNIENNNVNMILLIIVGVLMRLMSTNLAELFRIAMYFDIFCIISIPEACVAEKNYSLLITLFISILLVAYYFISKDSNIISHTFI